MVLAALLVFPIAATAQNSAINGFCTTGGVKVMTSGSASSTTVQASYPKCLVSVYLTGTTTLASIFSDASGTPLANPFTANTNASWLFYSALGAPLDIVMSGGTPIAFPAPVTLTGVISGTSGIITSVNTLVGAVTLAQGSNITITPIGGNALQISSTGGGGSNPDGLGTAQSSTKTGGGFLNGGTINTNAENMANNGPSQTQSLLCASGSTNTVCSMFTPPTSTDTSVGQPLPVLAGKPSSAWQDLRHNTFANWFANPIPQINGLAAGLFPLQAEQQVAMPSVAAFTTPFPAGYGFRQGSPQNGMVLATRMVDGYSLGNLNELFPTPLPGYSGASPWAGFSGRVFIDEFNGTAIKQGTTIFTDCLGTADCQMTAGFGLYGGGCISVSDECVHGVGSFHLSTPGDTIGTITTVIDPGTTSGRMQFRLNITQNSGLQGQGRYFYGSPLFTTFADKITLAVSGSQTPGTVVFNDITLPVSTARGFMTSYCDSGVQDINVAIGKNGSTPGCDVTVDPTFGVGHFDTSAPVCTAFNVGGLWNYGSQVASVTGLVGGHQTIQMWMHKPAPANAVIYQGGACGMGVHWIADDALVENTSQTPVSGSVVPCIGSTDAHTMLCPVTIIAASHAGTREVVNDFGGPTPGPHAEGFNVNLSRAGNVVSGLLEQGSFLSNQFWFDQLFFQVANCTDTSFNGQIGSLSRMPGPNPLLVQWDQTGPDSAGCTNALIYPITAQAAIVPMVEIYSVADPSVDGSVPAANVVNDYFATGVNPYFATPGNLATTPTHFAAGGDAFNVNTQYTQPLTQMTGLNIIMQANSMEAPFGAAVLIQAFNKLEGMLGTGGNATQMDGILIHSPQGFAPVKWVVETEVAPSFLGGGIRLGPCSGFWDTANDTFCTYPVISVSGTQGFDTMGLINNPRTDTLYFTLHKDGRQDISFNRNQSAFNVPTAFSNLEIESNVGGVFGGNFAPTQSLSQCTTVEPNGLFAGPGPCWHRITTALGSAHATTPGSGTNRVIYLMIGQDSDGLFASGQYLDLDSPGPITPTDSNTITCLDLPAGLTAKIYLYEPGLALLPVSGAGCTTPTDVVVDIGTYDAAKGPQPWIAGIPFFSGGFYGNTLCYLNSDPFGTNSNVCTAFLTQSTTAAGTFLFSGASKTDILGILQARSYGTGTASNRDSAGEVTLTTGTGSFSFTGTYASRPECSIHDHTTPANDHTNTFVVTNTTITITGSGSDVVGWACIFRN